MQEFPGMSIVKNALADHEDRVNTVTLFAIEVKALVLDEAADRIRSNKNPDANKLVYAWTFKAWAEGQIEGTAEEVFEQEALDVE
jgi:hypothetical protein